MRDDDQYNKIDSDDGDYECGCHLDAFELQKMGSSAQFQIRDSELDNCGLPDMDHFS
jgi:hypothetical protein